MEEMTEIKVKNQESGWKNKEWKEHMNKEKGDKKQKEGNGQKQTKCLCMQLIYHHSSQIFMCCDG